MSRGVGVVAVVLGAWLGTAALAAGTLHEELEPLAARNLLRLDDLRARMVMAARLRASSGGERADERMLQVAQAGEFLDWARREQQDVLRRLSRPTAPDPVEDAVRRLQAQQRPAADADEPAPRPRASTIWSLEALADWLNRSNESYQEVVRKLSTAPAPIAVPGIAVAPTVPTGKAADDSARAVRDQAAIARELERASRSEAARQAVSALEVEEKRRAEQERALAEAKRKAEGARRTAEEAKRTQEVARAAGERQESARKAAEAALQVAEERRRAETARLLAEARKAQSKSEAQAALEAERARREAVDAETRRLAEQRARDEATRRQAEALAAAMAERAEDERKTAEAARTATKQASSRQDQRRREADRLAAEQREQQAAEQRERQAAEQRARESEAAAQRAREAAEQRRREAAERLAAETAEARSRHVAEQQRRQEEAAARLARSQAERRVREGAARREPRVSGQPTPTPSGSATSRTPVLSRPAPAAPRAVLRHVSPAVTPVARPRPRVRARVVREVRHGRVRRSKAAVCHRAGARIGVPGWYVVRRGDNLWRIASRHYSRGNRYRRIYARNRTRIQNPDLIYPCQRFYLPRR